MRRKTLLAAAILSMSFLLLQCSHTTEPEVEIARELTPAEKSLVQSSGDFGLKFFRQIVSTEKDQNIFVSPLSISMALGMTLNGAAGTTQSAMEQTLELSGLSQGEINQSYRSLIDLLTGLDRNVIFEIANSIWYRQEMTFEQAFIELNQKYFDAVVRAMDFGDAEGAAHIINAWVNEKTHGKIDRIVEAGDINWGTVMFLINAIYFKGSWQYQFDPANTFDQGFALANGSTKAVPMMHLSGALRYAENDLFQSVDLLYGSGKYSMTVFLPKSGTDIDALAQQMNASNWQNWLAAFEEVDVDLALPKFTLKYELELSKALTALGMGIAFDAGNADFTGMHKDGGLYIGKVKHKTFLEINEEGTEAAAVTSVEIERTSVPVNIQMQINRSFLFAIRDSHSGTILFIGKIIDPGA